MQKGTTPNLVEQSRQQKEEGRKDLTVAEGKSKPNEKTPKRLQGKKKENHLFIRWFFLVLIP